MAKHAQREYVHQRITVVAGFENRLAAHRRHTKTITVMRDAADYAFEDALIAVAKLRVVEWAETQRIQDRERPRAHGKNVAQNTTDAGSRSLKRFDEAGMIVRLDLERDGIAIANIDNPRVLAGADQNAITLSGKFL